ncbi:GTP cyclohydrolase I FolE [Staphylococcus hominis]|uniref:GTP cyclohydrolase 1 n=1 Tax=Staphylococcus hominis TaxID=1290 RepID=A0A974KXQ7_STAHO|nr:GTP cyclohydrolase I FolE [Staphylococcus hominis]RIO58925.1 GTP cyclohydrolase I FolE [Staphylococcus hominis]
MQSFGGINVEYNLSDEQYNKILKHNVNASRSDVKEVMTGIENLITLAGDDVNRDGLRETPFRVVKAYMEYTEGYRENPNEHLRKTFDVDHNELVIVRDIEFNSLCEHHFAPFYGRVHIGYIPNEKVTGLSKFGRMVDGYAKRFQVQEHLTTQIADVINDELDPLAVMVVIEARHMCMCGRGIRKGTSSTTTSAVRGQFKESAQLRNEFLSLINSKVVCLW